MFIVFIFKLEWSLKYLFSKSWGAIQQISKDQQGQKTLNLTILISKNKSILFSNSNYNAPHSNNSSYRSYVSM